MAKFKYVQVDTHRYTMDPSLSNFTTMDATEDFSLCNSTLMNLLSAIERLRLEREERATARLEHRRQIEQELAKANRAD